MPQAELVAWTAPELFGPWTEHPLNPIKVDPSSARPAGRPFQHAGRLLRPGQDCSMSYGGAVVLNEILQLDERGLLEVEILRLEPGGGEFADGLHTLSGSPNGWIIDGCRNRFSPAEFRRQGRIATARLGRLRSRG
jgi:hypothetical protein